MKWAWGLGALAVAALIFMAVNVVRKPDHDQAMKDYEAQQLKLLGEEANLYRTASGKWPTSFEQLASSECKGCSLSKEKAAALTNTHRLDETGTDLSICAGLHCVVVKP